ncbi:MAG: hypothetical protein K2X27_13345 [Candidatus Obscuribacterales bacterium]|nr:hypothetical protein [Candidatus Obscuribacterales bacterium]
MQIRVILSSIAALFILTGNAAFASDDPAILEAQKFFKQFSDLERAYDPAEAELYAPNAVIKDTRVYEDGQSKTLTWTGENYKQIVKAQLPVSKARNEQYSYSQPVFQKDGSNVRLRCQRSSISKKYSAPLEMLIAPTARGWKIIEESCQSQP